MLSQLWVVKSWKDLEDLEDLVKSFKDLEDQDF